MFQRKSLIFSLIAIMLSALPLSSLVSCDERKTDEESLAFLMSHLNEDTDRPGGANNNDDEMIDGGACTYKYIYGTAHIISVVEADPEDYNCQHNPVKVTFDFYPSDFSARKNYIFPQYPDVNQDLTIGSGINPPGDYISAKGIYVGKVLRCIRSEIINGTCTPVMFQFPDIDFSDYGKNCWE